jgi:redox-sensitive bicupin YhaK (pirin superfamily)
MLAGHMQHGDNHGNRGDLGPGSVQWMTAGRGVVHSEMPEQESGRMRGFQLWVNLPAREKMVAPAYQEFAPDRIPQATPAEGVTLKVIAGQVGEVTGPIRQPATEPLYLDIELAAGARWSVPLPEGHNVFAYVFEGQALFGDGAHRQPVATQTLAVLGGGRQLSVEGGSQGARLILVAGKPLREPVARYGPFVMNTREELMQAFADYQDGKF